MNKIITVTAQIGKCIYHIEMQTKNTLAEIINEVKEQLELTSQPIKIIKYVHQTNQSTN